MLSLEYEVWLELRVCDELDVKVGDKGTAWGGSGAKGGNSGRYDPSDEVGERGPVSRRGTRGRPWFGRGVTDAVQQSARSLYLHAATRTRDIC